MTTEWERGNWVPTVGTEVGVGSSDTLVPIPTGEHPSPTEDLGLYLTGGSPWRVPLVPLRSSPCVQSLQRSKVGCTEHVQTQYTVFLNLRDPSLEWTR